jgi:hypothetical protein
MALGFGKKKSDSSSPSTTSPHTEKTNPELTKDGVFSGDQTSAENGGQKPRKMKMNRIDGPITKPIGGENVLNDDSTDSDVSIGKQMEMEAGNAIKYRTCSWKKVNTSFVSIHSQWNLWLSLCNGSLATVAPLPWQKAVCPWWQ